MVAPLARNQQKPLCEPVALEAVLLEHALRGDVVDERPGLEPVQLELAERVVDDLGERGRREAAAGPRLVDPVGDDRALQD